MLHIHREGLQSKGAKPNYVPDECFRAEVNYPEGLQKTPSHPLRVYFIFDYAIVYIAYCNYVLMF